MILEAYTALAVVFAAKAIVRREDMSKNSLFFLAGTMVNVTYSNNDWIDIENLNRDLKKKNTVA